MRRPARGGGLPDFQDSVVPFQGLQKGFCPKAGDVIVGEPAEEDGMVSFRDAHVSSWACPIKGSFGSWPPAGRPTPAPDMTHPSPVEIPIELLNKGSVTLGKRTLLCSPPQTHRPT